MTANLIRVMMIAIPLNIIGFFVDEKLIVPSMLMLALLAIVVSINLIMRSGLFRPRWHEDAWIFPFVAFLLVSIVSLFASPILRLAAAKGAIQIVGITCAILTAYGVAKRCSASAEMLGSLCRLIAISMGWVAIIGVAQFLFWNVFGFERVLNFSFMNELYGRILWREPGKIGEVARINSILAEPAYMTRILGLGCGLALVRLGIVGKQMRVWLRSVVPLWSALAIVTCYLLSTSLLGYLHVYLVTVAAWVVSTKFSFRNGLRLAIVSVIAMGLTAAFVIMLGEDVTEKVGTIALITNADDSARPTDFQANTQSARAFSVNLELAVRNFTRNPLLGVGVGGHPVSYYAEVSDVSEYVFGLNVDDAASLGLRLISETGLAGLLTFLVAISYPAIIARRAVVAVDTSDSSELGRLKAIGIALLSSWIGLAIIYLARTGLYFDAAFWVMIGLVAALPRLMGMRSAQLGSDA